MTFGSLFAGCGGLDKALEDAGMECAWQVEIDRDCNRVLERHWPGKTRRSDVRGFGTKDTVRPDWIVGGFPCQDLSVAGRRAGLDGARSGLWHEFRRIVEEFSPAGVLVENVPGLLSGCGCPLCCEVSRRAARHISDERKFNPMARDCGCRECRIGERLHRAHSGRNLAIVLAGLEELGYGLAWRILDAQWFGVPQRRRRVFVVGCLGDWRRASEILFESDCLPWGSPPSREAGTRVAPTLARGSNGDGANGPGRDADTVESLIATQGWDGSDTAPCLDRIAGPGGYAISHAVSSRDAKGPCGVPFVFDERQVTSAVNRSVPSIDGPSHTLHEKSPTLAFQTRIARNGRGQPSEVVPALTSCEGGTHADSKPHVAGAFGVRRLMPVECEALQGMPRDWTRWDAAGKELSDSARYRMVGNSVALPVVTWIGRRIMEHCA